MRQRAHHGHMHDKLLKYEYIGHQLGIGRPIFGQTTFKSARLLLSQLGVATGETLEIFTHSAYDISGTTPIEYHGDYYIISSISESETRLYVTAKAGRVQKVVCETDELETKLDALRRPVKTVTHTYVFDAFWLERYEGNTVETEGHGITAQRMVLLLPKDTDFACGTVFRVEGEPHVVTKRYMSGRHWNEYELLREEDR